MSVLWKGCTTQGATVGGFLGLITAVGLTILSKSVWVDVLHNKEAIFPYTSPALFSMIAGFAGIWLFSVLDTKEGARLDRQGYVAQKVRSETGIGAAGASGH
jgi:cation/acetate symporter